MSGQTCEWAERSRRVADNHHTGAPSNMLYASLDISNPVLSTDERILATYPFKPKLNKTPRPSTTPVKPKPLTSEERELAFRCTFRPKLNSSEVIAKAYSPPEAALDALEYGNGFKGQLKPALPKAGSETTANGGVVLDAAGICWQRGPYGSWWMRLGAAGSGMPTLSELRRALDVGVARAKGALFVGVQELKAEPRVIALLRARGFGYQHFSPNEPPKPTKAGGSAQPPGEHVYYKWLGDPNHDMVPCYATSIEGVGALVLSPDEKKVLLVWEYGNWKPLSGAVDQGESILEAAGREAGEECGVTLDDSFAPVYVGGWQAAKVRDNKTNDNFHAMVVRAATEKLNLDMNEVSSAVWFDTASLLKLYDDVGRPTPQEKKKLPIPPGFAAAYQLPEKQQKMGTSSLSWLYCYKSGGGLKTAIKRSEGEGDQILIG